MWQPHARSHPLPLHSTEKIKGIIPPSLLLPRRPDSLPTSAGGLGVLPTHAHPPVMADTTVGADLLEALEVLAELGVDDVGGSLGGLVGLPVTLPVWGRRVCCVCECMCEWIG